MTPCRPELECLQTLDRAMVGAAAMRYASETRVLEAELFAQEGGLVLGAGSARLRPGQAVLPMRRFAGRYGEGGGCQ